jgi:hypothetical protein
MGFIAGCFLLGLIVKILWDFATKPAKRQEMLAEYLSKPMPHLFMTLWMVFFIMAFVGIFVPIFGLMELTDDGWQVWEVGIIGFFGMWVASNLIDTDGKLK